MIAERRVWPCWSVDLPGLTEDDTNRLLAWAADQDISLGGIALDPADTFSVHMDHGTVTAVLEALRAALRPNNLTIEQMEIVRGFADQLADWVSG